MKAKKLLLKAQQIAGGRGKSIKPEHLNQAIKDLGLTQEQGAALCASLGLGVPGLATTGSASAPQHKDKTRLLGSSRSRNPWYG